MPGYSAQQRRPGRRAPAAAPIAPARRRAGAPRRPRSARRPAQRRHVGGGEGLEAARAGLDRAAAAQDAASRTRGRPRARRRARRPARWSAGSGGRRERSTPSGICDAGDHHRLARARAAGRRAPRPCRPSCRCRAGRRTRRSCARCSAMSRAIRSQSDGRALAESSSGSYSEIDQLGHLGGVELRAVADLRGQVPGHRRVAVVGRLHADRAADVGDVDALALAHGAASASKCSCAAGAQRSWRSRNSS